MASTVTNEQTMVCMECNQACQRFGKHRNGLQRFRCIRCKKTYTEAHERMLGGMTISDEKALLALRLLLEGNSMRSTQRITDLDINTIMKILVVAGEKCEKLIGRMIVNVPVKDVECDEIWGYIGKKQKRVRPEDDPNLGGGCPSRS